MKKALTLVVLVAIIGIIGYFIFGRTSSPVITISNNSNQILKDVILIGSGFEKHLDDITPNQNTKTVVFSGGESGLAIQFTAGSEKIRKNDLAYIESSGGYTAHIMIDEYLIVSCTVNISDY